MTLTSGALDPQTLMARAEVVAGADDWGHPPFREALDILCDSARRDADISLAGRTALTGRILTAGVRRLKLYADRGRYPEIAKQKIIGPLVLTGLPRSGAGVLHALLAQDPAARSPLNWELADPSPPPRTESFAIDPRIARAEAAAQRLDPEFRALHPVGAQLPDECGVITALAFQTLNFSAAASLPSYVRWLLTVSDAMPAYVVHKHVLQHLQAFAPRSWWCLQSPQHLFWLDRLMETYPDARVVMVHRDPATALPANAGLVTVLRRGSGQDDPKAVGAEEVAIWGQAVRRALAYRESGACAGQFFDCQHDDFVREPIETVEAIYEYFDMTLTDEARARMTAFMAARRQAVRGKRLYAPDQFGLDAKTLRREFGEYIETLNIPTD
jgi:hypothetical protein